MFRSPPPRCPRDGARPRLAAGDPLAGTTIGDRYVLEEVIGSGATGVVYRAHHVRLSRLFAIKMLFGDVAVDPIMRMRFCLEAEAASRLAHPNVVSVVDVGHTAHHLPYLAMEYVEGETLSALIAREAPLDPRRVLSLSRQLCRGLAHAHRAGLVHRDFKPANVAVAITDEGRPLLRILDFGLVISERTGDPIRGAAQAEHGQVVGTPIYISPEQARDAPVDHRADLFALGVVMYEMLAGQPPFGGSAADITRANVRKRPPSLSARNPAVQVSPALEGLVMRLMAKRPERRFQSAEEVIRTLDRLRAREPSVVQRPRRRQLARGTTGGRPGRPRFSDDATTWSAGHDGRATALMSVAVPVALSLSAAQSLAPSEPPPRSPAVPPQAPARGGHLLAPAYAALAVGGLLFALRGAGVLPRTPARSRRTPDVLETARANLHQLEPVTSPEQSTSAPAPGAAPTATGPSSRAPSPAGTAGAAGAARPGAASPTAVASPMVPAVLPVSAVPPDRASSLTPRSSP